MKNYYQMVGQSRRAKKSSLKGPRRKSFQTIRETQLDLLSTEEFTPRLRDRTKPVGQPFENQLHVVNFINDVVEKKKLKTDLKAQAAMLERKVADRTEQLYQALIELNAANKNLQSEIMKRKDSEARILQALEKEKELNELKSRFVSMASHEFRTPLGGILTSAALLTKYIGNNIDEKKEKHLKIIKSSVRTLTSILNDFLSLDRFEQGKIKANPITFKLKSFVKESVEEARKGMDAKHTINYIHQGKDLEITQDECMLKNILLNLISNAVKYSKPEDTIKVRTKKIKDFIQITVQDSGLGIPAEDQKNLFKSFFRAGNVNTIQGTGLGLNIVKRYLEYMGGDITFKSIEGVGTTFYVQIPMEI